MNLESAFGQLGVDAITGSELMDWLGITPDDLASPQRFSRFQSVVDYLKRFPPGTQRFLANKATRGKLVDKLDHMFCYTNLLKLKEHYENEAQKFEAEKSVLETSNEPHLLLELEARSFENNRQLANVIEEVELYEK